MGIKIHQSILKMSHAYFKDRKVTPKGIKEFIERAGAFYSEVSINKEWLYARLLDIHLKL